MRLCYISKKFASFGLVIDIKSVFVCLNAGLPAETPRDRERDQPPPPRHSSWADEADIRNNNNNNYNQSVTRKVQTFFRGAANGASNGISKVDSRFPF